MTSGPDLAIFDLVLTASGLTVFGERSSASRALNGSLYRLLDTVDGDLGRLLHDVDKRFFTVSPLRRASSDEPVGRRVAVGEQVRARIATLHRSATMAMHEALTQAAFQGRSLNLDGREFAVTAVALAPGLLPGTPATTTYQRLYDAAPLSTHITLRFLSLVRFRSSRGALPPPLTAPARVFGGYLSWWQTFGGCELPGVDRAMLADLIRLEAEIPADGRPVLQDGGGAGKAEFLGTSYYAVAGDELFRKGVACLALFAAYCGTGSAAAMGMGQTWPHLEG